MGFKASNGGKVRTLESLAHLSFYGLLELRVFLEINLISSPFYIWTHASTK